MDDYRAWMSERRIDRIRREDESDLGVRLVLDRGDLHVHQFVPIGLIQDARWRIDFEDAALNYMADQLDRAALEGSDR